MCVVRSVAGQLQVDDRVAVGQVQPARRHVAHDQRPVVAPPARERVLEAVRADGLGSRVIAEQLQIDDRVAVGQVQPARRHVAHDQRPVVAPPAREGFASRQG